MMVETDEDGVIKHIMATGATPEYVERRKSEGSLAFWMPDVTLKSYQTHFVDIDTGQLLFRPHIEPELSKTIIQANGQDVTVIRNLPTGSKVKIMTMGQKIADIVVDEDHEIELVFDYPGSFDILIDGPKGYYIGATLVVQAL